nr:hypothetical protein [Mycoplasmopsis bovis]
MNKSITIVISLVRVMGAFIDNYVEVTKKDFLDSNNVKFIVSGKT